jgi:chemotaxis signal transduction protein
MAERLQAMRARVGDRDLLIPSGALVEILPFERLEPIPVAIPWLAGILPLRSGPLPVLDWERFQTPMEGLAFVAVLRRRLGILVERILEVRDLADAPTVGLKRGDPWNPLLSHRCRLSGHSHGVLEVEKLVSLLHNRSFRR